MLNTTVIKLGGSLLQSPDLLRHCLDKIEQHYRHCPVVIVPGGGVFADQVRLAQQQWQFDDRAAHCMAVLAMQQMALLLTGLKNTWLIAGSCHVIKEIACKQQVLVWSPDIAELDRAGIVASWDVTSDSLAVWLAETISARQLLLVKSAAVDPGLNFQELLQLGIVDKSFCGFAAQTAVNINIINAQNL